MDVINKPIADLIPYVNNPRNNDGAVNAVASSIAAFGFKQPIVIDRNNVVVCGHTRLKAAEKLGLKDVPCVIADDLTDAEVKAYRLADNRVAEAAEWDGKLLELELESLDQLFDAGKISFGMETFGFGVPGDNDWFTNRDRNDTSRQDGNDEYNEFLDKFETKKTTDDCYTPELVYDAVADWVANEYNLDRRNFVRPFYPGGDYQNEKYKADDVVVDNPPFSILAEILNWYNERGVKFFLFGPTLTLFSSSSASACAIPCGVGITYENGATVSTSFLTNLEELRVRTAPELYRAVKEANDRVLAQSRRELPKYRYPDNVITAPMVSRWCKYGIDFRLERSESAKIGILDAQKESKKTIFGGGYLISEKAAAEKAAAIVWPLSDRERAIVEQLSK